MPMRAFSRTRNRDRTMAEMLRHMGLDEQIGQLLMVGFTGITPTRSVLHLIQSCHVGGIILFSRNMHTSQQTCELTSALQEAARAAGHPVPLLIATDQENGLIRRTGAGTTIFPGNMALGAINSEAATETVAYATGEELRAMGITMNLAPVVDIATNPANPVIGVRSFGADPELVARLGAAATRGYRMAGIAATLKHFPGHGDTVVDSHLALPINPYGSERLDAVELVPFRQSIAAGADAIMTAHIAIPAITGSGTIPATLAPEVIQNLLRTRLGFEGIVITDCLEMRAISDGVGTAQGAVQGLHAGADIVLISHRYDRQMDALAAIRSAAIRGVLSTETITSAAERVLRLKQHLPSWDNLPQPNGSSGLATLEHQRLADDLYARSITMIRDEAGLLPLKRYSAGNLLVVSQTAAQANQAADRGFVPTIFVDELHHLLYNASGVAPTTVTMFTLAETPTADELTSLRRQASQADAVILLTCNAHLPRYLANLTPTVHALRKAGRPLIGIAVCDPYDAMALPEIGTWLATYDYTPPALAAAARVLAGSQPASGTLPVTFE